MLTIEPTGQTLGATVTGSDLRRPLSDRDFADVLQALGRYGVLRFPGQLLDAAALMRFSARFGALQAIGGMSHHEPGMPEVTILSNVKENGKLIGIPDAGQDWHTDMTYNQVPGFVNVLVAHRVPMRDGKPLGATEFVNTQAAYEGLPADIKAKLSGATAVHDFAKYWEYVRQVKGSPRPPLTPEQRAAKPPATHPVFLTHPISGNKVIYVNPGHTDHVVGMSADESAVTLRYLFDHILKPEYRYTFRWTVGDLLLWDHLGTWHYAVPDYRPDEYRLMKRCQVMADKIFDPAFLRGTLGALQA